MGGFASAGYDSTMCLLSGLSTLKVLRDFSHIPDHQRATGNLVGVWSKRQRQLLADRSEESEPRSRPSFRPQWHQVR